MTDAEKVKLLRTALRGLVAATEGHYVSVAARNAAKDVLKATRTEEGSR